MLRTNCFNTMNRKRKIALDNLMVNWKDYSENKLPDGKECTPEYALKQMKRIEQEAEVLKKRITS